MYADIIIDITHEKLDKVFQYRVPEELEGDLRTGAGVIVPFGRGNRETKGYIVGFSETCDYDAEKIKDILRTDTSSVAIEARLVALAAWMKEYYGGTMIQALKTVLPIKRTEQQKEQRILKRCISREAGEKKLEEYLHKNQKARARLMAALLDDEEVVLVITVTTTGYLYGMMASVCSVLLFNYFFTVPVHTFAMTDQNDVVRLVFFLITGFISASIMVRFHNQVRIAEETRAQMEREKLKSNMLRSISHDFRTPLTGIMGAAGLLKEADELDAGVRKELAGEIQEQSVWLMRLMENILNMTKLESEEFEIRKNQEVVDDLIYEAVSHIIGLREKRRFEIKLPSELIVVNVDGKLMVQVLVNLLDNAMKHTGENGWICIEARYDAGKVWISVEDDGDGIQEDLKENIFDEFVTRSDEKGDRQRGIGLGLAICKAVVNAHGGNICAENRKEGGARFMFWLEARQVSTDGR